MSFVDEVNRIKNGVLSKPEYSEPIKSVMDRANSYTAELKIEATLSKKGDDERE